MLTRPQVPAMKTAQSILDELDATRELLVMYQARLEAEVATVAEQLKPHQRRAAANYFYWRVPELRVEVITHAFFGEAVHQAATRGYFDEHPSGYQCRTCGADVMAVSRTDLKDIEAAARAQQKKPRGGRRELLCGVCSDARARKLVDNPPRPAWHL